MVVDKYVGRCLDVGSTPTGSIYLLETASNRCFFIKDSLFRFFTYCVGLGSTYFLVDRGPSFPYNGY